jgi:predicted dienelactone hydrolase
MKETAKMNSDQTIPILWELSDPFAWMQQKLSYCVLVSSSTHFGAD